ncbi:MAG: TonB-dependent receptor [Acidobacteria bacterium]|nr:TonB-dependent receptor [Acidobacteriota bacterium]
MRVRCWVLALLLSLAVAPAAYAQRLTGTILGNVVDSDGLAVPGTTITVSSPALIRPAVDVSNERGFYRATNLPPGTYTLTAQLDGFGSVTITGIVVTVGTDVEVNVTMKPAGVSETVTVVADSPVVDLQQTKNTQTISKEALNTVPLKRDPLSAMQLASGVVGQSVQGSSRNEMAYLVDGVNVNAPDQGYAEANINWDTIEEVEFITSGNPAENFGVVGGALNIVTKSGGNTFSGTAQYYYTNKDLAQVIIPPEYRSALNVGSPAAPVYDRDASATLGGPILKDRTWFFTSYKYLGQEVKGSFVPVSIAGKQYEAYDAPYRQDWGFGKITQQVADPVRLFVSYNYSKGDRPHDFSVPYYRTLEATRHWKSKEHTLSSNLTWVLGAKTFLDARFGFWRFDYFGLSQPGTEESPRYSDAFSGYLWGGQEFMQDATVKRNYNGSVKLSRFVGDWHGSHEIKGGLEYQHGAGSWVFWARNSMDVTWWDGDIYYHRASQGLAGPDPVFGDGLVSFSTAAQNQGGSYSGSTTNRYGGFIQDTWRVNNRLTVNLGLRYDLTRGDIPAITKEPSDAFAMAIGKAYLEPVYGLNPFGEFTYDGWSNPIPWKGFAPQIGAVYDLFGSGKTAVKAHYGRYLNSLPGWNFDGNEPSSPWSFAFNWWDLNGNRKPDAPGIDRYEQADDTNPIAMLGTTWKQGIDPKLKTPYLDEFTAAIDHQLATDVRVSVGFTSRTWRNLLSDPYYDLETGQYWSEADSGYWVPFETIVPAVGSDFAAAPVTVYFRKSDSPDQFSRLTNIDGAKARYTAVDFTLNKRMSNNWQFGGSLVLSRMAGNYPGTSGAPAGFFRTPNYRVNRDGRIGVDQPIQIKLWGSAMLPFGMQASYFYRYLTGTPWNRTVTVIPPADWAAANGTATFGEAVNLEVPGTRRNTSTSNLDLRLEKVFKFGGKRQVGAFVDLFNALGFVYPSATVNPGGTWRPDGVGIPQGRYTPGALRLTGLSGGVRTIKLSARIAF